MFSRLLGRREKVQQGLRKSRESWYSRVAQMVQRSRLDEETWEELEEMLISADVGVAAATQLIESTRSKASASGARDVEDVMEILKGEIVDALGVGEPADTHAVEAKPHVVLTVGVNGVGKTTSIAKLAHYYGEQGYKTVLSASDTFRAGAIDQLRTWGDRLGVDVIAHGPGGDPAAIAYDALEAARARQADVVLVDTAGRLHTQLNLMEEMKKIARVLSRLDPQAPHETLLVLDATTGQNGLAQARSFTEAVGCTGVVLAKLDGTARGGVVITIVRELGLPVRYIGTGEGVDDIAPFDAREFVEELFSPASG